MSKIIPPGTRRFLDLCFIGLKPFIIEKKLHMKEKTVDFNYNL